MSPSAARKKTTTINETKNLAAMLNGGDEISVEGHVSVSHARRVERETGIALAIEKNQAAGAMRALSEQMNGFSGSNLRQRGFTRRATRRVHANWRLPQKINCGFCHHDFHDRLAVAGAGDGTGFGIGITSAANQRRIANATWELAAGAAGRSGRK